jgi:hypothetical protein
LAAADAAGLQAEGLPIPGLHRVKRGTGCIPRAIFFFFLPSWCSFSTCFPQPPPSLMGSSSPD